MNIFINKHNLKHGYRYLIIMLVVLACTVMQILTKTHNSVMVELIVGFRVESHTPDSAATHFYNEVDTLYQKMGSKLVALK